MELRDILLQYRDATEKFINALKSEEDAQIFIKKRQTFIDNLKEIQFTKEELRKVVSEIDLLSVEEEAKNILINERGKIKEDMIVLQKQKVASKIYGNQFGNINFLNKKI